MITKEQFLGLDDSKLVNFKDDPKRMLVLLGDRDAVKALGPLFADAYDNGFEIKIASAYRSFYKQFKIFDDKFNGKRPVLDANEEPMDISSLSDEQKVLEIVRFSAIPGFSRHNFGTDFDIYASNLLPEGKQLELTAREYQKGSYFYKNEWERIDNIFSFGEVTLVKFQPVTNPPVADDDGKPVSYKMYNETGYSDHLPLKCIILI